MQKHIWYALAAIQHVQSYMGPIVKRTNLNEAQKITNIYILYSKQKAKYILE